MVPIRPERILSRSASSSTFRVALWLWLSLLLVLSLWYLLFVVLSYSVLDSVILAIYASFCIIHAIAAPTSVWSCASAAVILLMASSTL